MIDKAAFIGMNGAQIAMRKLQIITNNLANVNTVGFRADHEIEKPYQVSAHGTQTRIYSQMDSSYTDFKKASTYQTGADLDIAIAGDGFIAVQSKSGTEGFTRAGSLDLNKNGQLVTKSGQYVMGNGGIITIPPAQKMSISGDGTISIIPIGATDVVTIDRIKLTNPNTADLRKGADGLFYSANGVVVKQDPNVRINTGQLEGSNVNTIDTLTALIDLSRGYEMHTNVLKTMSDNAGNANKLLDLPR